MDMEEFVGSLQLKQKLKRIEKDLPRIKDTLEEVCRNYEQKLACAVFEQKNQMQICENELKGLIGKQKYIYRVSMRIKTSNSLIEKIIRKLYEGKKLYWHIDADNYNKIVTDLVGMRIIHKFPDEWKNINKQIYELFDRGEESYISDYLFDYEGAPDRPFLVEKPVVYHLPDEDLSMYKEVEKEAGKSLFVYKPKRNYRSVHYIVNYQGIYCEIQVRTLSDELWGEIEHDFVYKQEISSTKDKLSDASALLRFILSAGDAVSMYMKEQVNGREDAAKQYWQYCRNKIDEASKMVKKEGAEK